MIDDSYLTLSDKSKLKQKAVQIATVHYSYELSKLRLEADKEEKWKRIGFSRPAQDAYKKFMKNREEYITKEAERIYSTHLKEDIKELVYIRKAEEERKLKEDEEIKRKKQEEIQKQELERKKEENIKENIDFYLGVAVNQLRECNNSVSLCESELNSDKSSKESIEKQIHLVEENLEEEIGPGAVNMLTVQKVGNIGHDVERHHKKEKSMYCNCFAIARAEYMGETVWLMNFIPEEEHHTYVDSYGISHIETLPNRNYIAYTKGIRVIDKNSALGGTIIRYTPTGKSSEVISSRAQWWNTSMGIRDIEIEISGCDEVFRFHWLSDLTSQLKEDKGLYDNQMKILSDLKAKLAKIAEKLKISEQKLDVAKAARTEAEEKLRTLEGISEQKKEETRIVLLREEEERQKKETERLREEEKQKKQEESSLSEHLNELKKKYNDDLSKIKIARTFIIEENSLRSRHLLDIPQEDAKRSHFFDGVPIVIEGGPGTGKTTTIIQRLKFLLSRKAIEDYKVKISDGLKEKLLDPDKVNENWLFISPTRQLLEYLRKNMITEGLSASEINTKTISKLRYDMFHAYKLKSPKSDGPFKLSENDSEKLFIKAQDKIADKFDQFVVESIKKNLLKVASYNTSDYIWSRVAIVIKGISAKADSTNNIVGLIKILSELRDLMFVGVSDIQKTLQEQIENISTKLVYTIDKDKRATEALTNLFAEWTRERIDTEEENIDEDMTDEEEEQTLSSQADFKTICFSKLNQFIKQYALCSITNKYLSKRNQQIFKIIDPFLKKEIQEEIEYIKSLNEEQSAQIKGKTIVEQIADNAWFMKNFATVCRGAEIAILNQIPRLYKLFRKQSLTEDSDIYDKKLLDIVINKKKNKSLYQEEVSFLIGYINRMLLRINPDTILKSQSNHKYIQAYLSNVKYVIGVDEATDYTLLDYYMISSFCNPELSSLTLCGDIMQGLNENGIKNWNELNKVLGKKIEVAELTTSYRQLPTLVEVSQKMYKDELGTDAPYKSRLSKSDTEPTPLVFVSNDNDDKAEWIAHRINEIYELYEQKMPSVAIFVGEDVNVKKFIKRLRSYDELINGINIEDCTDNRQAEGIDMVRVFNLSDVKGMEFEVAIFYDIDEAIEADNEALMRRYLYVGISRATSHLAATFTRRKGNENIIKYFNENDKGWM